MPVLRNMLWNDVEICLRTVIAVPRILSPVDSVLHQISETE